MLAIESLFVGFAIGCIVGLLGAGGGIISVPVLVYLLRQNAYDAAAGSLLLVGLTSISAIFSQLKSKKIRWREGVIFGIIAIGGSIIGARLSLRISQTSLLLLFACLLGCMAILLGLKAIRSRKNQLFLENKLQKVKLKDLKQEKITVENANSNNLVLPQEIAKKTSFGLILLAASCTGFLTGFFGVGGGFIVVPMLIFVLRFTMQEAAATSLIVMAISAASGLIARIGTNVTWDWSVLIPFVAASMLGGVLGANISKHFRADILTALFSLLLAGISAFLLIMNLPNVCK